MGKSTLENGLPVDVSELGSPQIYKPFTSFTLPETNIAPENWWLKGYSPFGMA